MRSRTVAIGHLVERAGGLLPVAGDEGYRRAIGQEGGRGLHLLDARSQLPRYDGSVIGRGFSLLRSHPALSYVEATAAA